MIRDCFAERIKLSPSISEISGGRIIEELSKLPLKEKLGVLVWEAERKQKKMVQSKQ